MIEVGAGIVIGPGITLGQVPAIVIITDFITETGVYLVSESDDNFIEEN